jgi:hypothetical protein
MFPLASFKAESALLDKKSHDDKKIIMTFFYTRIINAY